jgi:hypothetical protein
MLFLYSVITLFNTVISPRVRGSVVSVVGEVAKYEVPNNTWGELAQFLMQCVKNSVSAYREVGMFLFATLIETVGEQMKSNLSHMLSVFQTGLSDESMAVRLSALKAVQSFVTTIVGDKEVEAVIPLIPSVIAVIQQCIAADQEAVALSAFEIFDELVESKSQGFDSVIPHLIKFMLDLAVNTELDIEIRDRACTFLSWVIAFRPSILIKQKMVHTLINVAFKMLVEPEDDDTTDDDMTAYKTGSSLLDELAVGIPSKYVFRDAIEIAAPLTTSQNAAERKAGVTAIGLISEGCHQPMRTNLKQAVPILIKACSDESRQVREAANLALASFCEYLRPEIMEYHEQILPILINSLDDPSFGVREKSCYTLDLFCQNLTERVIPFLPALMTKLVGLLTRGDRRTQEVVIPVISGAAVAAKAEFMPYVPTLLPLMKQLMEAKSDDLLLLRGTATECVGLIAVSIGKNLFGPFVDGFLRLALSSLEEVDKAEMREYTYRFFENLSTTLGEDFATCLPVIVPLLTKTISADDVLQKVTPKTEFSFESDDEGDEDFDGEEIDVSKYKLAVRTSQLEEKAAAVSALGAIAYNTKHHFIKYLEISLKLLVDDSDHFHYSVRRNAVRGLKCLLYAAIPTSTKESNQPYNEQQLQLVNKVNLIFVTTMLEDDDKETVAICCESISELCRDFGRKIVERNVDALANALNTLIQCKCPCNSTALEEEEGDHDIILIDAVSDAIDDMARAIGPDFANQFKFILPELIKYAKPNRDAGDRMMALGTIAEVSNALKHGITPFLNTVLPIALNGIKDEHQDVKRNAIFCAGVLAYHVKDLVEPHIMQILSALYPVFVSSDSSAVVIDNSCGAIARIILKQYSIPLEQVLSVFLNALPLREDFEENDIVYSSVLFLIQSGNPVVAKLIKEVLTTLARILSSNTTQQEVRAKIVDTLRQVRNNQFDQAVAQCDTNTQQILNSFLN